MRDIPLHDIKPLVEVPDNSLMIFIISAAVLVFILVLLVIWLMKKYKKTKSVNLRKLYLKKIHAVDTSNAKQAAYEISEYGRFLAISDKEKDLLESLDRRLAQYKYKKEVSAIDDETLGHFHVFLEVVDAA